MKLRRKPALVMFACALLCSALLIGRPGVSSALPPADYERTELISGLELPTAFRFLPDGRIIITEKNGAIKLWDGSGDPDTLVTLTVLPTDINEERGLLGIEPHPDFATNGYLYVSYTTAANRDRLSRLTFADNDIDPASEVLLIESDQDGNIYHHGGEIRFGPDGKLYWAMGMNTINPNSQNLSNVHGKIHRLNDDGSAPADNPFINQPNTIPSIWAYGLRNPFRFNFAPNGKLMTGDVGGSEWEELNIVTKGANYGWPLVEGMCSGCPYINPVYAYPHTEPPASAGSITSVMAYTGSTFGPEYLNKIFIADYTLGFIKALTFDTEFSTFITEETFDDDAGTVVQLDQGPDGNMYQMNIFPGSLYRIAPSGGNRRPIAEASVAPTAGLAPLSAQFSSAGSFDPDEQPITYDWDFGDGTGSTEANPSKLYLVNGTYQVILTVSDGDKSDTAELTVTVGNQLPTATITSPSTGTKYNAGDEITFSGSGTDPDEGDLPGSALSWKVDFHHAEHTHPFRDSITGTGGSITIPRAADNLANTWYRIYLTATDSGGLKHTTYTEIFPNLINLTIQANHPDAYFTVDGVPKVGSFSEQAVVGVERVLDAPSPQYVPDGQYHFNNWSDGLAQNHTIITPAADTSYTVEYDRFTNPPPPWQNHDVGAPTVAGYASYDEGEFIVRGAGGDIWGPTDEFHYVFQELPGDGEIIARVTSQTDTDDWAKSGIMIKESATEGSPYALLGVTPANGLTFQAEFDHDGGSVPYTFPDAWVRLTRTGDIFRAYHSINGTDWTLLAERTIAMQESVTAGIFVSSHKFDTLNTTTFDNVSVNYQSAWQTTDIGAPALAGSSVEQGGQFTLAGAGDDIWGTADQFRYTYRALSGDGEMTARVTSQTAGINEWTKSGVMIKSAVEAGSPYAMTAVTPEQTHGVTFQHSFNAGADAAVTPPIVPRWVKIKRVGNVFTSFYSSNGTDWTQVGSATIAMPADVTAGMFVTSHDGSQLATSVFDNVSLTTTAPPPPPVGLPVPWTNEDVGAPGLAGSTTHSNGTFTLNGAGHDIWGDVDQFQFMHQPLMGDGQITAHIASQTLTTNEWAKSGVMIKSAAEAGSPYAMMAITPEPTHGATFQHSFNAGTDTATASPVAPRWLRIKRVGNVFTGYISEDGVAWTQAGSATIAMPADSRVGLFVTSHNGSQLATSVFDNVSVEQATTPPPGSSLPAPWASDDVGAPALAGSATYAGGVFTLNGAGNDIWDDTDQFHYVHQPLVGDGEMTARVTSAGPPSDGWAKYGIMIKNALLPGSPYAMAAATQANGFTFQHSFNFGVNTEEAAPILPAWLKLNRAGNVITASYSADGTDWAIIGSAAIDTLTPTAEIGLFVTSHNGSIIKTVTFDNITLTDN